MFADDPFGSAKAERQLIKEESDRMLAEMDKNVAERKSHTSNRKNGESHAPAGNRISTRYGHSSDSLRYSAGKPA